MRAHSDPPRPLARRMSGHTRHKRTNTARANGMVASALVSRASCAYQSQARRIDGRDSTMSAPHSTGNALALLTRRCSIRATGLSHLWVQTYQCRKRRPVAVGFSGLILLAATRGKTLTSGKHVALPTGSAGALWSGAASGAAPERAHCRPVQAGPKRRAHTAPVIYVYGCQPDIYGCNTSSLSLFFV